VTIDGAEAAQPDQPPVLSLDCGSVPEFLVGETVFVEAQASDPDGQIVDVFWELPDGEIASGFVADFEFTFPGENRLEFTAVDNDGLRQSESCVFTVIDAQNSVVPTPTETGTPPPPTSTAQPEPTPTLPADSALIV